MKCKVTVLKQFYDQELALKYVKNAAERNINTCEFFPKMGQSFIIDEEVNMPAGFCPHAWNAAVREFALAITTGGSGFFKGRWMKDDNQIVTCCNDGVRPVVFLVEKHEG